MQVRTCVSSDSAVILHLTEIQYRSESKKATRQNVYAHRLIKDGKVRLANSLKSFGSVITFCMIPIQRVASCTSGDCKEWHIGLLVGLGKVLNDRQQLLACNMV